MRSRSVLVVRRGDVDLSVTDLGSGPAVLLHTGPTNWVSLAKIGAPTLLVGGELEEPDGEAVVLDGIGHLQAFWRTDLILPVVRDFLQRHWPGDSGHA